MSEQGKTGYLAIEDTRCYQRFRNLANEIWFAAIAWSEFAQSTVGKQLVTCADSVPANMAEGEGRASDVESVRFFHISRGSARELQHWIRTAEDRHLVKPESAARWKSEALIGEKELNALISFRKKNGLGKRVSENIAEYGVAPANGEMERTELALNDED